MLNRRKLLATLLPTIAAAPPVVRASTPVATLAASPAATPQVGQITITGEGELFAHGDVPTFTIDITGDETGVVGTFELRAFPIPGTEWVIVPTEILYVKPISEQSPHIKRMSGYATADGPSEQPFLLDLADSVDGSRQELNFVMGADAAPFLGQEVKLGCDCAGFGFSFRAPFVTGGFTVTES